MYPEDKEIKELNRNILPTKKYNSQIRADETRLTNQKKDDNSSDEFNDQDDPNAPENADNPNDGENPSDNGRE